jgi:hypothetical protein
MDAKFNAILENAELETMAVQQALAILHQENREFQQQFIVDMQTFQTNMLRMFVASQQDTREMLSECIIEVHSCSD